MKIFSAVIFLIITAILIASLYFPNSHGDRDVVTDNSTSEKKSVASPREKFVLAETSTQSSKVKVFTSRYEHNLRLIKNWLPDRWDLIAILKSSAYGNDIGTLGPIASKLVPAVGVITNYDAEAISPYNPEAILRLAPTDYETAKEAVVYGLNIQEFVGSKESLHAVTRVAKEYNKTIDASIYLFKHYGNQWGFDVETAEALQNVVDTIDHDLVNIRDIFTHLVIQPDDTEEVINSKVEKFLNIACPVAVNLADKLSPLDPPIRVHWGASSEIYRLYDPETANMRVPVELHRSIVDCMNHPKIRFGVRAGTMTYSNLYEMPGLKNVLQWTSKISKLTTNESTTIAEIDVGIDNGYPRFFQKQGDWGKVSIDEELYPLVEPPQKNILKINLGKNPEKAIKVGTEVCLLCDELSFEDFYEWIAVDAYNIAMCATGASTHFAYATYFLYDEIYPACMGPVVIVSNE